MAVYPGLKLRLEFPVTGDSGGQSLAGLGESRLFPHQPLAHGIVPAGL